MMISEKELLEYLDLPSGSEDSPKLNDSEDDDNNLPVNSSVFLESSSEEKVKNKR